MLPSRGDLVGAGLCSARRCRFHRKNGRNRAPPLQGAKQIKKDPCKKVQPDNLRLHLLFTANIQTQLLTNPVYRIRRRVVKIRRVSLVWNARLKHWALPKFRGRLHPASPRTLFSPIFSLAREKIGPPEARQKRPRRNESLQARLLILCARFFLSKPQTKFAVWVFSMQICDNLSGA